MGEIQFTACFYTAWELRMAFKFFKDWKKLERRIKVHDIWKLCKIQMSAVLSKGLLGHSHVH